MRTMPTLSLREAAQQAGTSKSTILRAIQSGRLSAPRNDDGGYDIDPAELFRVYPPASTTKPDDDAAERPSDRSEGQGAPSQGTADTFAVQIRNARLEAEIAGLRVVLEAEKRRADELREERDRWHAQAEKLLLAAPVVPPVPPAPAPASPQRGGLFGWFRRAS
jgi:excisionase family DNA binding protein